MYCPTVYETCIFNYLAKSCFLVSVKLCIKHSCTGSVALGYTTGERSSCAGHWRLVRKGHLADVGEGARQVDRWATLGTV